MEKIMRGFKIGLLLGVSTSLILVLVSHLFYGDRFGWDFSLVTGTGVLVSMTIAATLGTLVPVVFTRVGIDPATATGPIVSTLTDIVGTVTYLGIATWFLL